jgi:hypothetical protein
MGQGTGTDILDRGLRPERWLIQAYLHLPKAARVVAFFIVLLVGVYLVLKPSILNGELVVPSATGNSYRAYDLGKLRTVVDGRSVLVEPNKDGLWGVPVTNALEDIEIRISDTDNIFHRVRISASDVWLVSLVTIAYDAADKTTPFKVHDKRYTGIWRLLRVWFASGANWWPAGKAFASGAPPPEPITVQQFKHVVSEHFKLANPATIPNYVTIRDVAFSVTKDEREVINRLLDLRAQLEKSFQVSLDGAEAQFLFSIPMEKGASYLEHVRKSKKGG